jgi:hypothetical protein
MYRAYHDGSESGVMRVFLDLGKREMDLCCNIKYLCAATRHLAIRIKLEGVYPSPIEGELIVEERRGAIGISRMLSNVI